MAEPEETSPIEKLIGWFAGWKASFEWLRKRIGLLGAIGVLLLFAMGAASLYVWSNWKGLKDRPGIAQVIEWWNERPIPNAETGRLTIAVAHLARDNERHEHEHLLLDELGDKQKFDASRSYKSTAQWIPRRRTQKHRTRKREACSSKQRPMF
jgi:hypothetical protein